MFARQHGSGDRLLRPDTSNGVFGTGDEPFRLRHSPAASPCHLEHSTPPQLGNVAGAIGAVSDVILESCKRHDVPLGKCKCDTGEKRRNPNGDADAVTWHKPEVAK